MVRSITSIKVVALLIVTVAVASANDALAPQKEALKDIDMVSYRVDEQGDGRELFDISYTWSKLLFDVGWCGCAGKDPLHLHTCFDQCTGPHHPPRECNCGACTNAANYAACVSAGGYVSENGEWIAATSDEQGGGSSATGENRSTGGAARSSNWWMYVVGAATVALIGGAIVMRKRRNAAAEDELNGDSSLSGAVNKRAALLAGGAAAAAPGASMPKFLNVPSFRRNPSGLEVGPDGAIIEPSSSSYMDMDNHVDPSQLPDGVEVSPSGNLEPYHSGSMA